MRIRRPRWLPATLALEPPFLANRIFFRPPLDKNGLCDTYSGVMARPRKLSEEQLRFVDAFVKFNNGALAYRIGYTKLGCEAPPTDVESAVGSLKLLKKPYIQAAIEQARKDQIGRQTFARDVMVRALLDIIGIDAGEFLRARWRWRLSPQARCEQGGAASKPRQTSVPR